MSAPLFSVIIPAYEQPEHLAAAIRSVRAQTLADFEILVVDDGSDPPLETRIERDVLEGVRYFHKPNGGGASARDFGARRAEGSLIAFLDHDDEFLPDKLARHAEVMASPDVVLSYSRVECVQNGKVVRERPAPGLGASGRLFDAMVAKSIIPGYSAAVLRASALREAGYVQSRFRIIDDYELWFRLAELGRFEFIPEILVRYRIHEHNLTRESLRMHEEYAELYETLLHDHAADGRARSRALRAKTGYHHRKVGDNQLRRGRRSEARAAYLRSLAFTPWSATSLGRLLRSYLPAAGAPR